MFESVRKSSATLRSGLTQEGIVFAFTLLMFAFFSIFMSKFLATENLLTLVRSVSVLGMLSLGMSLVVIGRGIDLSLVATMVVAIGWALTLVHTPMPLSAALVLGAIFAVGVSLLVGFLVAFAGIPAIFTTLAMGSIVYGIGRLYFLQLDVQNAPSGYGWFDFLGRGDAWGVPTPIGLFAALALLMMVLLRNTRFGRFVYAAGDNPEAATISGVPVRAVRLAQFVGCGVIAYLAGIVMASAVSGINTRIYNSTIIYDVLLVVAVGGISLSGGLGGVRNVVVGTLFVGVMLNGMTILNIGYTEQNLIKSLVLLAAIILNTIVNPRDEQTGQQGDI